MFDGTCFCSCHISRVINCGFCCVEFRYYERLILTKFKDDSCHLTNNNSSEIEQLKATIESLKKDKSFLADNYINLLREKEDIASKYKNLQGELDIIKKRREAENLFKANHQEKNIKETIEEWFNIINKGD